MTSLPIVNTYLSNLSLKIRSKSVAWEGYQRANLLSAEDVTLIQRVTGQKAQAESILAAETETYASLYIRLLNKLSRADTVQSLLSLISDMLADHDERISLFLALPDSPYTPLLKLLDSQDDFVRLKSTVLTSTFLASDSKPSDQVVSKLLFHLSGLIRNNSDPEGQDVGVQCLEGILAVEKVRKAVWAAEDKESDAPKITEG
ncbi:V-type H+-transporting ATPase subunit H, partial [Phenoliferia sp. Uapishka_3]